MADPKNILDVVVLAGPSGAWKTSIIGKLTGDFVIQPERYMEANTHRLNNKQVLSKWLYIGQWFDLILRKKNEGMGLVVADRSPLDTVAYARDGEDLLLRSILRSFEEIRGYGVRVQHILVTAEFDVLTARIKTRLLAQPDRSFYNESDDDFCRHAYGFYERHTDLWQAIIDTSHLTLPQAVDEARSAIYRLTRQEG